MTRPRPTQPARPALWLASKSPRRREMLTEAGIDHGVISSGIDDGPLRSGEVAPQVWAASLAYLKAAAGAENLADRDNAVVLGADTLCVLDSVIIGQPQSPDHAREIITSFQNREHPVITGVALLPADNPARRVLFADTSIVRLGTLTERDLDDYIESNQWRGKAGGYNIHERIDAGWPITYEGDPSTIVGLPMQKLLPKLAPFRRPCCCEAGAAP